MPKAAEYLLREEASERRQKRSKQARDLREGWRKKQTDWTAKAEKTSGHGEQTSEILK